ncbi:MAG: L,D-transpeptidase family protein [Lachnospiraceae bacterium]|nr:L,D-transpeptidase family protein [Lachnospiraceae bacterium]
MRKHVLLFMITVMGMGMIFSSPKISALENEKTNQQIETTEIESQTTKETISEKETTKVASETTKTESETTKTELKTTARAVEKKTKSKEILNFERATVKINKITLVSKKKIKLQWEKIEGATGYLIYRKTDEGGYKKIATVNNADITEYTNKKLKYGTAYNYTIKAYKEFNGKTYYSSYKRDGYNKVLKVKKKKIGKYHYYFDMDKQKIENVQNFLEKPKYCIKVNILASVVTIYAKNGNKGYTIPVKAYLCSGNIYDTCGKFKLGVKYRFRGLYYNCHSQWASRIHGEILFHTVPYKKSQNPTSLDVKQYNLLGTPASHGCIRLQCAASKWINDNCPIGTKVIFYKSQNPGPLGKPKLEKLKSWHTWDPTDPSMKEKCKEHNCKHTEI